MFRKRFQDAPPAEDPWQDLVARLELKDASAWTKRLRSFLALGQDTRIYHNYRTSIALAGAREAKLYFFDYEASDSAASLRQASALVGGCMLSVPHDLGPVSLRAVRRPPHKVLEALGASATGSAAIKFEDESFNDAVTVYARDEAAVKTLLGAPLLSILKRALTQRGVEPTFLLGERQLLFFTPLEAETPKRLLPLELLAADLLSLYALITASAKDL